MRYRGVNFQAVKRRSSRRRLVPNEYRSTASDGLKATAIGLDVRREGLELRGPATSRVTWESELEDLDRRSRAAWAAWADSVFAPLEK